MKKKKLVLVLFSILYVLTVFNTIADEKKLNVLTTTNIVEDLVKKIAQDDIEVFSLMGVGVDPHLYQPTAKDIKRIQDAEIIFFNGYVLEAKLATILEQLTEKAHAVTRTIPKEKLSFPSTKAHHPDPHLWFDLSLWKYTIDVVVKELSAKLPKKANLFKKRGEEYKKELKKTDQWIVEQFQILSKDKKTLVTPHDAFQYYAKKYQISYYPIQGISTATEASLSKIIELANFLSENKIKAVFLETTSSPKTIEALVKAVQSKNHNIVIGGTLYSDSLGKKNTPNDNLIGVIQHNTKTIISALK